YVTFWHEGQFLAKVARPIAVEADVPSAAAAASAAPAPMAARSMLRTQAVIAPPRREPLVVEPRTPDLTLWVLEGADGSRPGEVQIVVESPWLQPASATERVPTDLAARV